jgi:DNA polymerase III subunit beta
MIFTASRGELADAISRAASGLPSRPLQDIYAMIHVMTDEDSCWLTAGDGDTIVSAAVSGLVSSGGSCAVPGRMLAEMAKYFAGSSVTLRHDSGMLEITAGRSRMALPAIDGGAYPKWLPPPAPSIWLDGEQFTAAIRKVAPAAGSTPPALTAVCLDVNGDVLRLVASDGGKMAYAEVKASLAGPPPAAPALLPARAARRFAATGSLGIGWDDALIGMQADGARMASRQIAGKYLPWQKVLAKEPGKAVAADARELTRALRMAQLAAGDTGRVQLAFSGDGLAVSSGDEGRECSEHVSLDYDGDDVTFLFGAQDLLDGLAGCGAVPGLAFTRPPAPLFLRDGEFRWMIAPRREL